MRKILKNLSVFALLVLVATTSTKSVSAQTSPSVLYVPLVGITSVPNPLALPKGTGSVTYNYAVKNFLQEEPLTDIKVEDDTCSPVEFKEGDDNSNNKLDFDETWRYSCTATVSETTQSIAKVTASSNSITATQKSYSTVVVGVNDPAPLVSVINITKVAYPLSLPIQGGDITFTYRVNNPGVVPLSDVSVTDDRCSRMSGKVGDTNANNLLDIREVWIYRCTTHLTETTTNTVRVTATANKQIAISDATITVEVDTISDVLQAPLLPETGEGSNYKTMTWQVLFSVLLILILSWALLRFTNKRKRKALSPFSKKK